MVTNFLRGTISKVQNIKSASSELKDLNSENKIINFVKKETSITNISDIDSLNISYQENEQEKETQAIKSKMKIIKEPDDCKESIKWLAWKAGMKDSCSKVYNWIQIEAFKTGKVNLQQALEFTSKSQIKALKDGLIFEEAILFKDSYNSDNKISARKIKDLLGERHSDLLESDLAKSYLRAKNSDIIVGDNITGDIVSKFKSDFQIKTYLLKGDYNKSLKIDNPIKFAAMKADMNFVHVEKIAFWFQVSAFLCCRDADAALNLDSSNELVNYSCGEQMPSCYNTIGDAINAVTSLLE